MGIHTQTHRIFLGIGDIMIYKKMMGSVEYSKEDDVFYGQIMGVKELYSYEGFSICDLRRAFEEAVDDYINYNQMMS